MYNSEKIMPVLAVLIMVFLIFLVCREAVCWYWKINRTVNTLDEILAELKKMNKDRI